MALNAKVDGVHRPATPKVKVTGSWRAVAKAWQKKEGTWLQVYQKPAVI